MIRTALFRAATFRAAGAGAFLLSAVLSSPALAQELASQQTRDFVAAAAQSDAFEIMEAQAALAQSKDAQVRAFAQRMIHDHGETSRALAQAATSTGLEPPPMIVGAGQAPLLGALQGLTGSEFDTTYWHQQALAHRAALVTTQRYAMYGDVPALKQVASAAVPVIQAHLVTAEQMAAAAGS